MPTRRVGMQVAGPGQHSRPAARSQWFATVLSGSTTLGRQRGQSGSYGATAARRQCRGPPARHRYRPSDALPDLQLRHLSGGPPRSQIFSFGTYEKDVSQ
jgi:hypothetical protein